MKEYPFDTQEFYELMQTYRCMPQENQKDVVDSFEAVKDFCKNAVDAVESNVSYLKDEIQLLEQHLNELL